MLDNHSLPEQLHYEHWGLSPVFFKIGSFEMPAYSFFVMLGLIAGILVYIFRSKRSGVYNENAFYIFIAAFVFGAIGAKLPIWIINYQLIVDSFPDIGPVLSGRTIVGGLIGGTIGVILTKKVLKLKVKMGNQIAPAAAIGVGIGRIGCLFRGCCYGKATGNGFGIDLGDGILRHPTQIYEIIFHFAAFFYILYRGRSERTPGALFKLYINLYFIFRFITEFVRVEPIAFAGLTAFQLATLLALLYVNRKIIIGTVNLVFDKIKQVKRKAEIT